MLFRGFAYRDPEDQIQNEGSTRKHSFFWYDDTPLGPIASETSATPDSGIDIFQVEYDTDEYGRHFRRTERAKKLSIFDIDNMVKKAFAAQMAMEFEYAISQLMQGTQIKVGASDAGVDKLIFKYDGTTTGWGTSCDTDIQPDHLIGIRTRMEDDGVEPDTNGLYNCILSSGAFDRLFTHDDMKEILFSAYQGAGSNHPYINGFKGRSDRLGFNFYKASRSILLDKDTACDTGTAVYHALFFGADPVNEWVVSPEKIVVQPDGGEGHRFAHIYSHADIGWRLDQPLKDEPSPGAHDSQAKLQGLGKVYHFRGAHS
jgi:hypothetical protein